MSEATEPVAQHVKPPRTAVMARLRTYFLTGVVIVGPLAVTAYITWWFIDTVDHVVRPLLPERFWPDTYLPVKVPGTGCLLYTSDAADE